METLDPAALENLREMVSGDTEFITELVYVFLDEAPKLLSDMRQALESDDAALLYRAAHNLKSNSAGFGAIALSGLCRELESMGRNGAFPGVDELLGHAKAEYAQVKVALETVCQDL